MKQETDEGTQEYLKSKQHLILNGIVVEKKDDGWFAVDHPLGQ